MHTVKMGKAGFYWVVAINKKRKVNLLTCATLLHRHGHEFSTLLATLFSLSGDT
jgi:hypothetical protein